VCRIKRKKGQISLDMLIEIFWESESNETPCSNKALSDKVNLSRVVKIDIPLVEHTSLSYPIGNCPE